MLNGIGSSGWADTRVMATLARTARSANIAPVRGCRSRRVVLLCASQVGFYHATGVTQGCTTALGHIGQGVSGQALCLVGKNWQHSRIQECMGPRRRRERRVRSTLVLITSPIESGNTLTGLGEYVVADTAHTCHSKSCMSWVNCRLRLETP